MTIFDSNLEALVGYKVSDHIRLEAGYRGRYYAFNKGGEASSPTAGIMGRCWERFSDFRQGDNAAGFQPGPPFLEAVRPEWGKDLIEYSMLFEKEERMKRPQKIILVYPGRPGPAADRGAGPGPAGHSPGTTRRGRGDSEPLPAVNRAPGRAAKRPLDGLSQDANRDHRRAGFAQRHHHH